VRVMTAAFILTGMRVDRSALASIYAGVRLMHQSSAYDVFMDEGRVDQAHKTLLRQGTKRLGGPAPVAIETELRAITDIDRLDRLSDAMLTAKTWAELLATP
jgi:hypothetical protein